MSTNFYVAEPDRNSVVRHLGQRAGGWKFLLQANNFEFYHDWPSMQKWLSEDQRVIFDDYGDTYHWRVFAAEVEAWQDRKTRAEDLREFSEYSVRDGYEFFNWEFF